MNALLSNFALCRLAKPQNEVGLGRVLKREEAWFQLVSTGRPLFNIIIDAKLML